MLEAQISRRMTATLWVVSIALVWLTAVWLGHRGEPWAIEWTDRAIVIAIIWTYTAAWGAAVTLAYNRKVMIFRLAAATLSLVFTWILLELPAVTGLVDYGHVRAALASDWDAPAADFVLDHEFSFRRPPHAHWSGRPRSNMAQVFNLPIRASYVQTFSTDSQGFRNATDVQHADIALVGDSYIEGAYISDEETAAVRLHEITGQTVANLGVSGYGPEQELKVLQRYALPLGPRMVAWFFFEGNDLDDDQTYENAMAYENGVPAPGAPKPPVVNWRELANRSFTRNAYMRARLWADGLIPNALDSFGLFRDASGMTHRFYFFDFYATREVGDYERERLKASEAAFQQGFEIAREHGIGLTVYYIPIKFRVYGDLCSYPAGSPCTQWHPWNLEALLAAYCRDSGIPFVSLTEPMRQAAAEGQVLYAPEDSHWNAAGHAFVAHQVAMTWDSVAASPK